MYCLTSVHARSCETGTTKDTNTSSQHVAFSVGFFTLQFDRYPDASLQDRLAMYQLPQNGCIVKLPLLWTVYCKFCPIASLTACHLSRCTF